MLTPEAPFSELPARLTEPLLLAVTVELLAATAVFSSPAAVTLSIWLSRSARALLCCFSFFWDEAFALLWPYACPETTKAATKVVLTRFFTLFLHNMVVVLKTNSTVYADRSA